METFEIQNHPVRTRSVIQFYVNFTTQNTFYL